MLHGLIICNGAVTVSVLMQMLGVPSLPYMVWYVASPLINLKMLVSCKIM